MEWVRMREQIPGEGGKRSGALVAHSPNGRWTAHARQYVCVGAGGKRVTGEGAREEERTARSRDRPEPRARDGAAALSPKKDRSAHSPNWRSPNDKGACTAGAQDAHRWGGHGRASFEVAPARSC